MLHLPPSINDHHISIGIALLGAAAAFALLAVLGRGKIKLPFYETTFTALSRTKKLIACGLSLLSSVLGLVMITNLLGPQQAIPQVATASPTPTAPSPDHERSPAPVVPVSDPCAQTMAITRPAAGSTVDGASGVLISLHICGNDGSHHAWLLDYDTEDHLYYRDNDQAFTGNNDWSFHDKPIGDPGDVGKIYKLTLLDADARCNAELTNLEPNRDGDYVLAAIPDGCVVVQTVDVKVTYPRR